MDVNTVMSTYNLNSLWNDLNPNNSSTISTVPLVDTVDATVKEDYTVMNYSGKTTSSELQDIYSQLEPEYGISLTYNQNGNLSIPNTTTLPVNGDDSNIISLLNSGNTASQNSLESMVYEYNSIENGTYKLDISSILSSNSSTFYSYIDSLSNNQNQSSGNNIDFSA
ncbi:hypothetical protein [Clostridium saccharoperbutylacetonicum]